MAHYYLDSSALVKRYVVETGTAWMADLCAAQANHALYTARISAAEIVAALTRRARGGSLALADAQAAIARFKSDLRSHYQIVEVTEGLIDSAMALAEKHGLRGYDAVQLAAALELHHVRDALALSLLTFICADAQLNTAAAVEGLLTDNPGVH